LEPGRFPVDDDPAFFAVDPPRPDDDPLLDLLLPDERLDVDREPDELFALLLEEPDDELLLLDAPLPLLEREPPPLLLDEADLPELERPVLDPPELDLVELDFAEPERPELDPPLDLLRDDEVEDLDPPLDDERPPPLDFDRDDPLLDRDDDLRPPPDRPFPDRLLPDDEEDRPPEPDVIVSAAAPTAPTAAPVAAPDKISPATSTTLSTIFDVVVLRERDEPPRDDAELFRELPELDLLAMYFLPI